MGRIAKGWTLRRTGNRAWRVRFIDANGRRTELTTGCSDKAAAAIEAQRIYARVVGGIDREAATSVALADAVAAWLVDLYAAKSAAWASRCEDVARRYWLTRWQVVGDITNAAVRSYITARLGQTCQGMAGRSGRVTKPETVRRELQALSIFAAWCVDHGYLEKRPTWKPPQARRDYVPICITADQAWRIIANLPAATSRSEMPVRAFVAFVWATALRKHTVEAIQWSDVDFAAKTLRIRAAADKAGFERTLPLSDEAIAALRAQWGEGSRVGTIWGRLEYKRHLRVAAAPVIGANAAQRLGLHALRHSRITDWASRTHDVGALQFLAGHRSLATTQKYLHARQDAARAVLNL